MKILKNARQKNVVVDTGFYTLDEINGYIDEHLFFTFDNNYDESYSHVTNYMVKEREVRIFLDNVKELKVIYDREYECYITVAVLNDDKYIYVSL